MAQETSYKNIKLQPKNEKRGKKKGKKEKNYTHKSKARWVKDTARSARLNGGVNVTAWSQMNGKTCVHRRSAKAARTHTTKQVPGEHRQSVESQSTERQTFGQKC